MLSQTLQTPETKLASIEVPTNRFDVIQSRHPDLVYGKELRNGRQIRIAAGPALDDLQISEPLAQNIAAMSRKLPNLLHQSADGQAEQIVAGNSVAIFAENQPDMHTPIRYATIYPYEDPRLQNWGEVGTACSFPENHQPDYYSRASARQNLYPGVGTELYAGIIKLGESKKMGIVGTTTGIGALYASLGAGFTVATRGFVSEIAGDRHGWAEVCQPCDPDTKTFSQGDDGRVKNNGCRRCFDRTLLRLSTDSNTGSNNNKIEAALEQHPRDSRKILKPCIFRYFIPDDHPNYSNLLPKLLARRVDNDILKSLTKLRNNQPTKFY